MNEILANPAVQTALIAVIVMGLNALVAWLKAKFPTQSALVESNWCYLQPAVEAAIEAAQTRVGPSGAINATVSDIVAKALTEFADSYRKLEGKDATAAEIESARKEIAAAVARAL